MKKIIKMTLVTLFVVGVGVSITNAGTGFNKQDDCPEEFLEGGFVCIPDVTSTVTGSGGNLEGGRGCGYKKKPLGIIVGRCGNLIEESKSKE